MTLSTGILLGIAWYATATAAAAILLHFGGMRWKYAMEFGMLWPVFAFAVALLWDGDGLGAISPSDAEKVEAAEERSSKIDDWSELKS